MDGEGGRTVESRRRGGDFDLPAILAQLDDGDPASRRRAVETVRSAVDDRPEAAIPTVPKLRSLLTRPEAAVREEAAYCLAELAAVSPADVAPSAGELASFAADHGSHPATRHVLRCLSTVAAERPDAVVDHVEAVVVALESRPASAPGVAILAAVSREYPAAIESAAPVLAEAVAADHAEPAVRNEALGCLGDVASHHPAAVAEHCPTIVDALDRDDPTARANAAAALARVAADAPRAIEPGRDRLLELLGDEHADVRAKACLALAEGQVERAREPLEGVATDDPEPIVRERASWALSRLS